jgi:hypothetical protein
LTQVMSDPGQRLKHAAFVIDRFRANESPNQFIYSSRVSRGVMTRCPHVVSSEEVKRARTQPGEFEPQFRADQLAD